MHYLLETKECEEYGGIGFVIKGKPNRPHFQPSQSAVGLTHDILEHSFKPVANPVEDELFALGAFYYIRILGVYNNGYTYPTVQNLSYEICELLRYEEDYLQDPKQYWTKDKYVNADLKKAVKEGIKLYKEEYSDEDYIPNFNQKYIIGWLAKGYSYTKARYRKWNSLELAYIFKSISEELKNLFKCIDYEGQQFKLNISLQTNTVNWKEIYDKDYS